YRHSIPLTRISSHIYTFFTLFFSFFFLMIRPPPRSTLFPTRRSSDLNDAVARQLRFRPSQPIVGTLGWVVRYGQDGRDSAHGQCRRYQWKQPRISGDRSNSPLGITRRAVRYQCLSFRI